METSGQVSTSFSWVEFYKEFADKLFQYKDNRTELLVILESVFKDLGMKYPFTDKGVPESDICPFTVYGCFNKGITDQNRKAIMGGIGFKLGVKANVPEQFDGIPVLNNMNAWFYGYKADRKPYNVPRELDTEFKN